MSTVFAGAAVLILGIVFKAFTLPLVLKLVYLWTQFYTGWLPSEVCERRRAEIASDLHEHQRAMLADGYGPSEIAVQIFFRLLLGTHEDIAWSLGERSYAIRPKAYAALEILVSRAVMFAIDRKDPYTIAHSQRVARSSALIARAMGLSDTVVREIRMAALLHDVGKLRIPGRVIRKPSRLTSEECAMMRSHATVGGKIVRLFDVSGRIAEIVRHHHEHWDGTGYPAGLRADQIPLGARIVLVADAYDALVTNRPYRRGASRDEAIDILENYSESQFDRDVVDVLRSV